MPIVRPRRRSMFRVGLISVMLASLGLSLLLAPRSLSAMGHNNAARHTHHLLHRAPSGQVPRAGASASAPAKGAATVPVPTTPTPTATAPTTTPVTSPPNPEPAPTAPTAPTPETLDSYIAGILATIPEQWRVAGWVYTIVAATPNGAMGDTWGPVGQTAPYSEYSRSLMTPLMASTDGREAIEMVVLHEAMNAKAYSVVDANNWSSVPGWPAAFAAQVSPEPGYDDIDAAANCLELGALGFSLNPGSGYAEEDIAGGCSPALASWLTRQVAAAT
jgi:hypothetical protein